MAITSFDISCDKIPTKSSCSTHSSKGNSCRLLKINFATDGTMGNNKVGKHKRNNAKSPYLSGDRVQLLSRVTEKRLVHKKTTDFVSSFPLAVNIYKANSDEFKSSKKVNKKVKKSVLTLPNDPAPVPKACTVSDMNDSEYCDQTDQDRKQKIIKKRIPVPNTKKARVKEKDFEFYDRDAQYCSQLNIHLDSSSTDLMKHFNGDGKRVSNKKKMLPGFNKPQTTNNLSDVWTVLRNINRFQFRPSPPMSEESIIPIKKKVQKRRNNRKDTRVIETCRTEEFAYISSYELDEKSPHCYSPSSSIDRVTVIDKKNEFSKICEEFEKRLLNTHDFLKDSNRHRSPKNKIQSKNFKNSVRTQGNIGIKENKELVPLKKKKRINFKPPADQQSKSGQTNSSSGNMDSLIDTVNVQINDNSDVLSHNTQNDSLYPTRGSFIYSDHSGSSKAELPGKIKHVREKTPIVKESSRESSSQSKEKSKIVLSKDHDSVMNPIAPKRIDLQKRKPRLVTTMPSSCIMPKLTQTEIKRRLARIKFPLVILGKDQVSSSIQVLNYDPPQFSGLDEHIWPFMLDWSDTYKCNNSTKDPKHSHHLNRKCNAYPPDLNPNKARKRSNEVRKQTALNDKTQTTNDSATTKNKIESKRPAPNYSDINDKLLKSTKKQKSIVQLKDKMLNFLYKKSSSRNVILENQQNDESDSRTSRTYSVGNFIRKVDATTDTQEKPIVVNNVFKKRASPSPISTPSTCKKMQHYSYPWAKGKWASDFIENVIKKIRSGVYYSADHKEFGHKFQSVLKEVSVQAGSFCDSSDSTQTYESDIDFGQDTQDVTTIPTENNFMSIPGFNNTLPVLEIKTLNMNQISVKHCLTNVMVQFDVTIPAMGDQITKNMNKSLPLIPMEVTESHTKIFKCRRTILNAILPAELCSILPKMMRSIIDSNSSSDLSLALCPSKTDSCLSTISELTRYENPEAIRLKTSIHMTPKIQYVNDGKFSNNMSCLKSPIPKKNVRIVGFDYKSMSKTLPQLLLNNLSHYNVTLYPIILEPSSLNYTHVSELDQSKNRYSDVPGVNSIQQCTCTTMEVYTDKNKRLSLPFKPFDLVSVIENIISNHNLQLNLNLPWYFDMLKLQYDGKNIKINISMTNEISVMENMSVTVNNLKIDSLYKALPKNISRKNHTTRIDNPLKCIEYITNSLASKSGHMEISQLASNKIKRRGFYKLYRKCKSTTNIPSGDKCTNIPLNKVTNLEDFFQILGSKKMLCSVFDGYAAKKILSSIIEMKNWITEINPKQALLILLLTNKKDTPNLVRFRPILLQGIAVNRITRATELDMEIEVIERENLNKFSQFEGITYLPESVTNYDNLLEELYWIAKTTASDYQKPFDESSERLLKSLLEKRKKLNPSYLRVMARYVGLGLLKSPNKS